MRRGEPGPRRTPNTGNPTARVDLGSRLARNRYAWLTDAIGWHPEPDADERRRFLMADRGQDENGAEREAPGGSANRETTPFGIPCRTQYRWLRGRLLAGCLRDHRSTLPRTNEAPWYCPGIGAGS